MTPELINFIDWVSIFILIFAGVRLCLVAIKFVAWSEMEIELVSIAYHQGKIKTHPLFCHKEIIAIILTILWLAIM